MCGVTVCGPLLIFLHFPVCMLETIKNLRQKTGIRLGGKLSEGTTEARPCGMAARLSSGDLASWLWLVGERGFCWWSRCKLRDAKGRPNDLWWPVCCLAYEGHWHQYSCRAGLEVAGQLCACHADCGLLGSGEGGTLETWRTWWATYGGKSARRLLVL